MRPKSARVRTVIAAVAAAITTLLVALGAGPAHADGLNFTHDPYWVDIVNTEIYRVGSVHWSGRVDDVHTGGRMRARVEGTVFWPAGTPSRCARIDVEFDYHDGSSNVLHSPVACNPAHPHAGELLYSLATKDIVKTRVSLVTAADASMMAASEDTHADVYVAGNLGGTGSCAQLQRGWDGVPVGPNFEYAFSGYGTYGCDTVNGNTTAHVDGKLTWKDALSSYRVIRVRVDWIYADGTVASSFSPELSHRTTELPVSLATDRLRDIRAFTVYIDGSDGHTWTQVAAENFQSYLGSHSQYTEPF